MMNRYLSFLLLGLVALPALGQEMADYYRIPDQQHHQYERLLTRYGGAYTRDRWYFSLGGFMRTDRAQLDNTFNGLIGSESVTKPGWSALIGWSYRERWAVEAGYTRSPIHSEVRINNGYFPYTFQYTNDKQALVLRGKRMILSTSGPWRRSGFWLTGGAWLVPNSGQDKGNFSFAVNDNPYWRKEPNEPYKLKSQTVANSQPTAIVEAGMEYNVRLTDQIDLGFSVRKLWGLGSSLTTNVSYVVNGQERQQAQLSGNGSGMSYGMALRYTYAARRKMANVLGIQGKQRIK